ncbi:hypothetical protein ACLOJK_038748 [Asimina triloba]
MENQGGLLSCESHLQSMTKNDVFLLMKGDEFNTREICQREFYLLNGNSVPAAFMTNNQRQLLHSFDDRCIRQGEANVGKFRIPKLKMSFGFEAKEMFKEMVLDLPFSIQAEFHDMVEFVQKHNPQVVVCFYFILL